MKSIKCIFGIHNWFTAKIWELPYNLYDGRRGWFVNECSRCGKRHRWLLGKHSPTPDAPPNIRSKRAIASKESYEFAEHIGKPKSRSNNATSVPISD